MANVLAAHIRGHASKNPGKGKEISADVQAALTVLLTRDTTHDKTFTLNLRHTWLPKADLTSPAPNNDPDQPPAHLANANLNGAHLRDANLGDADLSNADLSNADLSNADLSVADLYRADLTGADLTGADLTGADLTGAIERGAIVSDANGPE
ncbi:pentapeptide repeat-containing protein [Streptomyces atratus]|uniref:pentapeptide repeat-containing protein n=1 Tax=Streptomyces atratus TaxID=1893 RepID=UPI002F90CDA1